MSKGVEIKGALKDVLRKEVKKDLSSLVAAAALAIISIAFKKK